MSAQIASNLGGQPGGVVGNQSGPTTLETLSPIGTEPALREFLQPESLTKIVQATGITEQLRAEHTIQGDFRDPSRSRQEPNRYNYSITPVGNGSCLAAEHQPRLRVNQDGKVEGLLALEVKMTIKAMDSYNREEIAVAETLWVPIRNGQPLRDLRGFVTPCEDGEHYLVQESEHSAGAELLIRAVERSEAGKFMVFDGRASDNLRATPARWDPYRREAVVFSPGHVSVRGTHSGEASLDLRHGDTFDGRQVTYQSGSKFHPAHCINDDARVSSTTPAVVPLLDGTPLVTAFKLNVISSHGPWNLSPEKQFSGLLELSNTRGSAIFALIFESRPVQTWNDFTVKPLQAIEAPGAKVAALVTLTPNRTKEEQPQPAGGGFWGTKPAQSEPSKDRIVPYVDGKMITTITIDANGQKAEIIEAKVKGSDGRPLPLEIRDGKVWNGTVIAKPPFSERTYSVSIQDGEIATTD